MAAHGNALDRATDMHRGKAHVMPLVAGWLTFTAVQWWLLAASNGSGTADPGWFLNGREAGFAVLTAIALVSALVAALRPATLEGAVAFWAGAVVAMIIVLFWTGPGTIFPIVIVFGAIVLGGAAFVGAGIGWLLRSALIGRTN